MAHIHPGPGQTTAARIIELASTFYQQSKTVTVRWILCNKGAEGKRWPAPAPDRPPKHQYMAGVQPHGT